MSTFSMRQAVAGFAVGAALFGSVDGYLLGEAFLAGGAIPGALAGALIGALIGAGLALLAWRPQPQDGAVPAVAHGHTDNYMLIWGVLFALTVIEVGVAFVALSKVAIIGILIVLAIWKAVLVALYYMHLRFEPRRLWLLAASPLPLAVILVTTVLFEGWR